MLATILAARDPTSPMPANILLVEDEPAIQELIAFNLNQSGHHVLRAASAEAAMTLVKNALPDLVLLDRMLPGQSGIEFAKKPRADERTPRRADHHADRLPDEQDKITGLETGADDYITKPTLPREQARIKAVLRRRAPQMTDDAVEVRGLKPDPGTHRVYAGDQPLDLGLTEFRLLHFFMTHLERVHSRAQLLDQVWGDHVFVEERTVDVHIRRLRSALKAAAMIRWCRPCVARPPLLGPGMKAFLTRSAAWAGVLCLFALAAWFTAGAAALFAVLAVGLAAWLVFHLYHVALLIQWMRHPRPERIPEGLEAGSRSSPRCTARRASRA